MLELYRVMFKEAIASKELCKGTVKLQGWMVSLTPVGEKDVTSPSTTFELKRWPKLAVIHTHVQHVFSVQQISTIYMNNAVRTSWTTDS